MPRSLARVRRKYLRPARSLSDSCSRTARESRPRSASWSGAGREGPGPVGRGGAFEAGGGGGVKGGALEGGAGGEGDEGGGGGGGPCPPQRARIILEFQ